MIANTPQPPYYVVIFSSLRTDIENGYDEMSELMVGLAEKQEGFLGIESARNELGITVSYWNGVNNPCPIGYRLPTEAEMNEELASWPSQNRQGAYASPLKFTVAGHRIAAGGGLNSVGIGGSYWTSRFSNSNSNYLYFNISFAGVGQDGRGFGCSVRCIKH